MKLIPINWLNKFFMVATAAMMMSPLFVHASQNNYLKIDFSSDWATTTLGEVRPDGTFKTSIALTYTKNAGNSTLYTFSDSPSISPVTATNVKLCTQRGSVYEWTDAGSSFVGVSGNLFANLNGNNNTEAYKLELTMSASVDSSACTASNVGKSNITTTAKATLSKCTNTNANKCSASSSFNNSINATEVNFWDVINAAPEPGTLALMLMALLGLAWFSRKRIPGSAT